MLLSLRLVIYLLERDMYASPVAQGAAVQAVRAPTLVNKPPLGLGPVAYPLARPFIDQAKAPCKPREGEVEIHGGCWVALEKHPPCFDNQAEHGGKCYLPVSARSRVQPEPQSFHGGYP
jgi:hypothetical protein